MALNWPSLFQPRAIYHAAWGGHVAVLAPGAIPTVDYYLTPRLQGVAHSRFDARAFDAAALKLPPGTFVVIVRHAAPEWLQFLKRESARWSGVSYLMDDDIPAAWHCRDVPLDYGLWTSGRYLRIARLLPLVCDRIWVSTPALRARYPGTRVVPPLPFAASRQPAPGGTRRWGYHGTRIHQRELLWLVPVVRIVQEAVPDAEFEVFGGERVAKLFGGISRVRLRAPVSWPEYLAYCDNSNLAVGLAPLLPGRFNAVRSHTKAFDIARCGAVGVFSEREPYRTALAGSGAILLPDDTQAWAAEIVRLLLDDELRSECYRRMAQWMVEVGRDADIAALINNTVMKR